MVYIIYCTVFLVSHYWLIETMPTVHLVLSTCITEWKIVISCYKSECNSPSRLNSFSIIVWRPHHPFHSGNHALKALLPTAYKVYLSLVYVWLWNLSGSSLLWAVGSSARLILLAPHFGSLHGIKSRAIITKLKFSIFWF